MKILKNKTYQGMVDKEVKFKNIICELQKANEEYFNKLCDEVTDHEKTKKMLKQLKEEIKRLSGAKGGYIKEINKLKKQVEDLDFKLKESMTDKYVVKKIPSGRRPKGQPMKLKDCSRISHISRKVFGEN